MSSWQSDLAIGVLQHGAPRRAGFVAFCLSVAVLTASLCAWQVGRAREKAALEAFAAAQAARPPAASLPAEPARGDLLRSYRVQGVADVERTLLLDNRTLGGRAGYEIYRLLWLDESRVLLVADGFVSQDADRAALPPLPPFRSLPGTTSGAALSVQGSLQPPDGNIVWSGPLLEPGWPARAQAIDATAIGLRLSAETGRDIEVYPRALLNDFRSLPTSRAVVRMPSSTHWGYAAQWAGLTAVALCGAAWVLLRRV